MNERRNVPEIAIVTCELLRRSQTRINLLFTMSEIPHAHPLRQRMRSDVFADDCFWCQFGDQRSARLRLRATPGTLRSAMPGCATHSRRRSVVEPDGIEPTTS